jgi:RHS repeat-associated protein
LSDGSNTYLYGPSTGSGGGIAQQNIVGRQYYLGDALGSVRQLANPAGTVIQARSYEPFGKQLSTAGNPLSKYAFTGEQQDPTGLIYLRARYYDPATGRFISKDPVRGLASLPQTLNPYTYAINNPVRYTDPSGQIPPLLIFAFVGLAGGVFGGLGYYGLETWLSGDTCAKWDWGDARFWMGIGGVLGTAIGLGGGWLGLKAGWWGSSVATTACIDSDCLNEIRAVEEGVRQGITVLGRYPKYIRVAKDVGGNTFDVPIDLWNKLNKAEQWALNRKFLDEAIARGDYFYLASRWADAPVGTFFRKELEYLFSKGYTLSPYQNYLIPPSKP